MKSKKQKPAQRAKKLPGFWSLCLKTWQELTTFWKPLFGVLAVYGVLYFVLVLGFNVAVSYQDIADTISAQLGGDTSWLIKSSLTIVDLFSTNNQSDAGVIVQFTLFVIASLAFIWTLRQLRTLKHIRMRDAYFDGTSRIIPTMLVMVLLLIPFIPAAIGSSIFTVINTGNTAELVVGSLITGCLLFVTFYWLVAWIPAIYIVSLPKGTPIIAIKSAVKLTKKHRIWMLRNIVLFFVITAITAFLIMLLLVSVIPQVSVIGAYVMSFVLFGVAQTYLFTMYRGLLDES
jgi:hypothetical protein